MRLPDYALHFDFSEELVHRSEARVTDWGAELHHLLVTCCVSVFAAECPLPCKTVITLNMEHCLSWLRAGPRRPGEGTENEEQGIVSAESTEHGSAIILCRMPIFGGRVSQS